MGGAVAGAALSICVGDLPASAADAEPIRLRFEAPVGCPGEKAFLEQIHARTAKARAAAPGEKARTFAVRLTQRGPQVRGRLVIEEPSHQTDIREITGERCDEVVSALALIAALAVDPQASTAPEPKLSPAPEATSSARADPAAPEAPPPPSRTQPPAKPPAPDIAAPSVAGSELPPLPAPISPQRDAPPRFRVSVGLAGVGAWGIAPRLALGSAFFVEAARVGAGALAFAPALRLAAVDVDSGFVVVAPVLARFRLRAARAELCPLRLALGGGASLTPCASFEAGALFAEGWGSGAADSSGRPWFAPGLVARARYLFADAFSLEIAGACVFPLVRDTFFIAPAIDVHAVPAAAAGLSGGVGVHFF